MYLEGHCSWVPLKGDVRINATKTKLMRMRVGTKQSDGDMVLHVTSLRVSMSNVKAVLLYGA